MPPARTAGSPRVEDMRTTPEEWTVIVDRMRRLHGMEIQDGEMDRLLKELCATQILTPDEQAKVAYLCLWHNSQQMEAPAGKDEEKLFTTCVRCHTAGKILSYRMTPEAGRSSATSTSTSRRPSSSRCARCAGFPRPTRRSPHLAQKLPYGKRVDGARDAKLDGAWAVFGLRARPRSYRGEARIADAGNAEYKLTGSLTYADGTSETFAGDGDALRRVCAAHTDEATTASPATARTSSRRRAARRVPSAGARLPHVQRELDPRRRRSRRSRAIVPAFLLKGEKTTLTVEGVNLPDAKAADVAFAGGAVKVLAASSASRPARWSSRS